MEKFAKIIDRRRIKRDMRKFNTTIAISNSDLIYYGWTTIPTKWGSHMIKMIVYVDPAVIKFIDKIRLSNLSFVFATSPDVEIIHEIDTYSRPSDNDVIVYFKDMSSLSKFKLLS